MIETHLPLNERKRTLLRCIVDQYVSTAEPVGSAKIAKQRVLNVSPATIRNDMAELEGEGYITRPHTSAGGVPADKAYRFFVEHLVAPLHPPARTRTLVERRFRTADQDLETWTRLTVDVLSQIVHNVAIASLPRPAHSRIKHLELVQLQEFRVLVVLVLQEARVRQHLLLVSEPVTQDELTVVANKLNSRIAGKTSAQIVSPRADDSLLERRVLEGIVHLLETSDLESYEGHYLEGLRHMLEQPEFAAGARARQAVEVLEDRQILQELLTQVPNYGSVRVIIGTENHRDSLHPFSIVVCQYGVLGEAIGTVSAIGPTRMDYATVIAGVQYLSQFMSGLMTHLHGRS